MTQSIYWNLVWIFVLISDFKNDKFNLKGRFLQVKSILNEVDNYIIKVKFFNLIIFIKGLLTVKIAISLLILKIVGWRWRHKYDILRFVVT